MAWMGIPFPLDFIKDAQSLVIEKLPEITLNAPFSWETIISSFVAGAIPAWVGWRAIKNTYQLAVLQNKQTDKKELAEKLRIAALEYVSSIDAVAQKTRDFIDSGDVHGYTTHGVYPPYLMDALDKAQRNERNLLLLIRPDSKGIDFLKQITQVNNAVQPYVTLNGIDPETPRKMKKEVDDFIFAFHVYMDEYGK
ncbi:hypothetical protein ACY3NT_002744 [Enterobacter sichuanensis]